MGILYICLIAILILVSILSQNLQNKKVALVILIILFALSAINQFVRVGFEKGLAGVIGMCVPVSIALYFLNKISKKS